MDIDCHWKIKRKESSGSLLVQDIILLRRGINALVEKMEKLACDKVSLEPETLTQMLVSA